MSRIEFLTLITIDIILEDLNKPDKLAPLQADLEKNSCPGVQHCVQKYNFVTCAIFLKDIM